MKFLRGYSAKTYIFCFVLSFFFFILSVLTIQREAEVFPRPFSTESSFEFVFDCVLMAVLFVALFAIVFLLATKTKVWTEKLDRYNPLPFLTLRAEKKGVLISWLVVLICWSPWVILAFPGDVHFDTVNQLYQYVSSAPTFYYEMDTFVDAEFLDHHPVFDTLLFGLFFDLGNMLGSQIAGIFIYVLLQVLLTAALMVFSICYLEKLGVPKVVRLLLLVFVALFPPFAQFAATMSKDTLFSLVYLAFFLCLVELYVSKGETLKNNRFLFWFIAVIVLCLLTKKTGVFIIALTGIALLVVYRSSWKRLAATFFVPIICCSVLIPTFIYPLLDVAPGGKQESLSPLFQQTAAFFLEHGAEVSQEEYEIVSKVLEPQEFSDRFVDYSVDPIKASFKADATTVDIFAYLGVWVNQGLRHPFTYLEATLEVSAGFTLPIQHMEHYGYTFKDTHVELFEEMYGGTDIAVEKPVELEALNNEVQEQFYRAIENSAILSFLYSNALWAFWIPILLMALILANRKDYLPVLLPPIIVILFLLITPTVLTRYMVPLLYTLPLLVGLMIHSFATSNAELGKNSCATSSK